MKQFTLLFLCITLFFLSAQSKVTEEILFNSGSITITPNESNTIHWKNDITPSEIIDGAVYRLIQFKGVINQSLWKQLSLNGITILDYIPYNAYIAKINLEDSKSLDLNRFQIKAIVPIKPEYKYSPVVADGNFLEYSIVSKDIVKLYIYGYPNITLQDIQEELQRKIPNLDASFGKNDLYLIASMRKKDISTIASIPIVRHISEFIPIGEPEDMNTRYINRGSSIYPNNSVLTTNHFYNGSGVKISVGDDGNIPENHPDFKGRILRTTSYTSRGSHGDHVSGVILSAGNLNPLAEGVAPGADLIYYNYPSNLDSLTSFGNQYNLIATNSSYGDGCNAGYNAWSSNLDDFTYNNGSKISLVFSAGNSGLKDCGFGAVGGQNYGNITGGHKVAKNALAIGNIEYSEGIINFHSSRGPSRDGRIKPDLVTLGTGVYSVIDQGYGFKTGSSISSPATVGVIAQLYQAFKVLKNDTPNSETIRALLINTATDAGNKGPDFTYGYGVLNSSKALKVLENNQLLYGELTNGNSNRFNVFVPSKCKTFKVTLCWRDDAGSPQSSRPLVTDLDLYVITPNQDTIYPWVPHTNSNKANLPFSKGINSLNNTEQVQIDFPNVGSYAIVVNATLIPSKIASQKFSIVHHYDDKGTFITYPDSNTTITNSSSFSGTLFNSFNGIPISWETDLDNTSFDIEYSLDNGSTWSRTSSSNGVSSNSIFFILKDFPNSSFNITKAKVRLLDNQQNILVTSSTFSLAKQVSQLKFEWACDDTVQITWKHIPNATYYDVFKLGEKYMEPLISNIQGNKVRFPLNINEDTYIAVRARGGVNGDIIGLRSVAIANPKSSFDCHKKNLFSIDSNYQNALITLVNNPSREGRFKIRTLKDRDFNHDNITIIDAIGKVVKIIPYKNNTYITIDISAEQNGLYLLKYKHTTIKLLKI